MAALNPSEIVNTFLAQISALPGEGGRHSLDTILKPALEMELHTRRLFATQRDDPSLLDPHIGLIDLFSTPANARLTRPRTQGGPETIFYEYFSGMLCSFPSDHLLPLDPLMQRPQGAPCIVEDLAAFRSNWQIFTHGALSNIPDWNNMIVAGGSVLACITPIWPKPSNFDLNSHFQSNAYVASDVDIFLWGLTDEQAQAKITEIYTSIRRSIVWPVTCVRKANTISIHASYPCRVIQFILRLYMSPAEILAGFDVDASCCAYDGTTVFVSPRALVACIRQANSVDITRRSPSYEVRLGKYSERGFEVYLPSLQREYIDYLNLYDGDLRIWPTGLGRLMVLEILRCLPYHYFYLYRSSGTHRKRFIGPKNVPEKLLDYAPIDKATENNYDNLWVRIPYGPEWSPAKIQEYVDKIDSKMNSPFNTINQSRNLHRHAVFCSPDIELCLGNTCEDCPAPRDESERNTAEAEANMYFRGSIKFITINPGRQIITGSFKPIDIGDWAREAYGLLPGQDLSARRLVYERDPNIDYEGIWARHTFNGQTYGAIYTQDADLFGVDGISIPVWVDDDPRDQELGVGSVSSFYETDVNQDSAEELIQDGEQSEGTSYYSMMGPSSDFSSASDNE